MMEHELEMKVSDNTSTLWVVCKCGFESALYTIEGDGQAAIDSANEEGERHMNPPLTLDNEEDEERPVTDAPEDVG